MDDDQQKIQNSKGKDPLETASEKDAIRKANKRGVSRLAAVQALYQMELSGTGLTEIIAEYENFRLGQDVDGIQFLDADIQWFRLIVKGVVADQRIIDPMIRQILPENWALSRLDSTLRSILRAGIWELKWRQDVPVAVIISEYVDIARAFFEIEEPKLVNGVLDCFAKQWRKK